MQHIDTEAVSSFCDAAASFLGDFEIALIAHLSDEATKIVEALIELDADCRNDHEILALIHRDAHALRSRLMDDGIFDAHAEWSNAVTATARNVERLCAGVAVGSMAAH